MFEEKSKNVRDSNEKQLSISVLNLRLFLLNLVCTFQGIIQYVGYHTFGKFWEKKLQNILR